MWVSMSEHPDDDDDDDDALVPSSVRWVVDCPRHGRAEIKMSGLADKNPHLDGCTVFPEGVSPSCDQTCMKQFNFSRPEPQSEGEIADITETAELTDTVELPRAESE